MTTVDYDTFLKVSLIGCAFASVLNFFFKENVEKADLALEAKLEAWPTLLRVELYINQRQSVLLCDRNTLVVQPWIGAGRVMFVLRELMVSALTAAGSPIKSRYFCERLRAFLTTEQAEGLYLLALLEGPTGEGTRK